MRLTGAADPFAQSKREQNQAALEAYPSLKDIVARADDPLHTAAKLAAAGNIIDLGTMAGFDVGAEVSRVLAGSFAVDHYTVFRRELAAAPSLLYLCDNCGEVVFDRLFLETIHALYPQVALTAVVKSGPIINDATLRDARDVALDRAARVVASGGALIGTPYREVSPEVRELLRTSAIVIAKGQGNFETSSALPRTMYFILKAKCPCVASELSVDFGDVVFLRHEGSGAWNDPA